MQRESRRRTGPAGPPAFGGREGASPPLFRPRAETPCGPQALPLRKPAKGRPLSPSFPPPPPAPAGRTPSPAGRFGSAETRRLRLRQPPEAAGPAAAPPRRSAALRARCARPPLTAPHLCSIIKTEPRYLCKMQYFVDDTDTRPSERNGRSYRYNYQNLTQQEEQ